MTKPKTPNQKNKYGELNKRLAGYVSLIQSVYETLNLEAAKLVENLGIDDAVEEPFSFSHYPETQKKMAEIQKRFVEDIGAVIYRGTGDEWKNSNEVQDLLANNVLKAYEAVVDKEKYKVLYQTNSDALEASQNRKDKGFNVSDKLWSQSSVYKKELEDAISCAIEKGMSAVTLSKRISKYLQGTGVKTALLTGSSRTAERREIHQGLEDGSIGIIVGTHALLEDNVVFRNLGLAIIDEQHRFGVEQRARLWGKSSCGLAPHILVMTATPIPRTLAMTLYGDLDVSVIDELPPGRKPVQTIAATESRRTAMFNFLKEQIKLGRQVFIVYPLIFESEKLDYKNLEKGYEQVVTAFPFPPYKTAIVHGQQSNEEKKFNMDAFAAGRADILVATSVIEVGVDVPNASVMVIESAERFGLSQLHQLRGRVGRGSEKSYCILMTGSRLSKESRHRIELMCATENGFELAEEDMKMRGPGNLEGTQQSGLPIALNIASLARDGIILNDARQCAQAVLDDDPVLGKPENRLLAEEVSQDKYKVRDYSQIS